MSKEAASSAWLEAITEARRDTVEKPPKGWQSRTEVHKQIGKSPAHNDRIINALIDSGRAERKLFRVETKGGVRAMPFFRVR